MNKEKIIFLKMNRLNCWLTIVSIVSFFPVAGQKKERVKDNRNLSEIEYSVLNLSATDALDRQIKVSSGAKEEVRSVGVFYSLWLGQHHSQQHEIYDIQKLLETNPDALKNPHGAPESPLNEFHFWGKPLYGYYSMSDPWVVTRHIELFCYAGIDYLCIDATNYVIYPESARNLFSVLLQFQEQGFNIPKVVFYTNSQSGSTVDTLYNHFYKTGSYESLWFTPDKKPMIIGITENNGNASDMTKYHSFSDFIKPEMKEYFDVRESQWPNGDYSPSAIPWMSWQYPQWNHKGCVAVPVAQHSHSVVYASSMHPECSRGYNNITKQVEDEWTAGANFQTMWDTVLSRKDTINQVLVTSFNEWMAIKYAANVEGTDHVLFVDVYNPEFSRDIEMMKGGYNDNFYLQFVRNVRKFKMTEAKHYQYPQRTINIHKAIEGTWKNVQASYIDFSGDAIPRDYENAVGNDRYIDKSNRNDIIKIKVTHDRKNVYFMIKTKENITPHQNEDINWMNIFIKTSGGNSFEGYQYVINRIPSGKVKTSIEKSTGGYNWINIGDAEYHITDNILQVSIPLQALGLSVNNYTFEFKVTDNVTNYEDIMDYYVTGDSAPIGRLNYSYGY